MAYIMDLEKQIIDGKWEGNIGKVNRSTIQIWTGKRFTGIQIVNFYTSGSIDDTKLKVFGEDGKIYITYEEVSKIEEEVEKIKPPLEFKPKETVFIEERLLEKVLDRVNELELKDGPPGKDLEFNWNGTELGVRVKGDSVYQYVDLKGADGTLDGLTAEQIVTALGYTPADENDIELSADKVELDSSNFTSNNVKDGMDELFQSVSNGKELIATAITDKGVETDGSDSFSVMAGNIGEISGGIELVAGDEIIYVNNTLDQVTGVGGDYKEKVIKKIKSTVSGNIRIKFNLYTNNTYTSYKSRGQIYINDIAEGVLREVVQSDGTVIFSEDFDITKDDIISLMIGERIAGMVTKNDMLTISTNINPLFKEVTV